MTNQLDNNTVIEKDNLVSKEIARHYQNTFQQHGSTPKGVGWPNVLTTNRLYDRMLRVIDNLYGIEYPTILDVGCGYGGLLDYIKNKKIKVDYTGLDILDDMIKAAKKRHPNKKFYQGDLLALYNTIGTFDYVVCNGVLTAKNENDLYAMINFAKTLIKKMFGCCRVGIAFNICSTYAKWYTSKNFYRNPLEILAFCLSELSIYVKLDHSYRVKLDDSYHLIDYTVYVYKDNVSLAANPIS